MLWGLEQALITQIQLILNLNCGSIACDNLPENIKYSPSTPFAFTEQGVSMLSSVLNSKKAIQVNTAIPGFCNASSTFSAL